MNVMREEDIVTGGSMSVEEATDRAARLLDQYGHLQGVSLIEPMVHQEFNGRITMTSSFGTEAAALCRWWRKLTRTCRSFSLIRASCLVKRTLIANSWWINWA